MKKMCVCRMNIWMYNSKEGFRDVRQEGNFYLIILIDLEKGSRWIEIKRSEREWNVDDLNFI